MLGEVAFGGSRGPPVIPPDPVELPADECERIAIECAAAAAFGYPLHEGRLANPDLSPIGVGV